MMMSSDAIMSSTCCERDIYKNTINIMSDMKILCLILIILLFNVTFSQTPSPTSSPTSNPTSSPTSNPTSNPTSSPTLSPTTSCSEGEFRNGTTCDMCEPGTFSNQINSSNCTECAPGTFSNETGSIQCQMCGINTYQNETGQTFCYDCPEGYFTDAEQSIVCLKIQTSSPTMSPTYSPTNVPTESPTKNPTSAPTTPVPTNSPTPEPTNSPSTSPTNSPTNSPTMSPTNSPTNSPTLSPTSSPTQSPTSSPTNSPTKEPTSSPTKSPTESAQEITHFFELYNATSCGSIHYESETTFSFYDCISLCDNDIMCAYVEVNEETSSPVCKKYTSDSEMVDMPNSDTKCFKKSFMSPIHNYNVLNQTGGCVGNIIYDEYFSDYKMVLPTTSQCRYLCNSLYNCAGFTLFLQLTPFVMQECYFHSSVSTSEFTTPESGSNRCYLKDKNIMNEFIGHGNSNCGGGTYTSLNNVEHGYYSCFNGCNDNNDCQGFEYFETNSSCRLFPIVNLTLDTGNTCWKKTFGEERIGKSSGRLRFTEGVFQEGVHDQSGFSTYIKNVLEDVLGVNVEITAIFEGSVVVDYLVDDSRPAFTDEDGVFIMSVIQSTGGSYNLGTQLIGGSNPSPPSAAPTMSPTQSPTSNTTSSSNTGNTRHTSTVVISITVLVGVIYLLFLLRIFFMWYMSSTGARYSPTSYFEGDVF